jgi:anti-sigma B factor antagonist
VISSISSASRREAIVKTASGPAGEVSSARIQAGCAHQRVDDFYCSRGLPFFAAVVSTCRGQLAGSTACSQHRARSSPTRVTLVGELDCATAPLLQTCFAGIDGNIEVDCSGLDFVGARGLHVLADARARSERADATFELVAPRPMLRRLLLITGVSSV